MSNTFKHYEDLVAKYKESSILGSITGLLHWDMQAMMPPKGAEWRTEQITALSGLVHKKLTDPQIGELLEKVKARADSLSEQQRANVREMDHDYQRATRIPQELVEEMAREQSLAHEIWVKAPASYSVEKAAEGSDSNPAATDRTWKRCRYCSSAAAVERGSMARV